MLYIKKKPSLLLKLDISKAFDTVDWVFMLRVLEAMGFGRRWRDWIASLTSSASTRILLNGEPGRTIHNARGVRQGDPLSPMLFILMMEVLHPLISKAAHEGILSLPASPAIHHQCSVYADDVMLFLAPKVRDVVAIRELLLSLPMPPAYTHICIKVSLLRLHALKCRLAESLISCRLVYQTSHFSISVCHCQ